MLDGSGLRIALIYARTDQVWTDPLVTCVLARLKEHGVTPTDIVVQSFPGVFDLPLACSELLAAHHIEDHPPSSSPFDVVIAMASATSQDASGALMGIQMETRVPIVCAISRNWEVTIEGPQWAAAAVEMGLNARSWALARNTRLMRANLDLRQDRAKLDNRRDELSKRDSWETLMVEKPMAGETVEEEQGARNRTRIQRDERVGEIQARKTKFACL